MSGWRGRRQRVEAVDALARALNALDYEAVRSLIADDIVISDAVGRAIHGAEDFLASDRAFREQAGGAELIIESAIENDGDVLVTGRLSGDNPTVSGATFWRVCFEGDLISRVEITRNQSQMTVTKFHAMQKRGA